MIRNLAYRLSRTKYAGAILRKVYHRIKWARQTSQDQRLSLALRWFDKNAQTPKYPTKKVDIIVPVYNAIEHLGPLLQSIYNNSDIPFNLIIIDDKSTDPKVGPLLEELTAGNENTTIVTNDENLGFVKSVNKALKLTKNDVVIVNSDVQVPRNWLSRLMYPVFEMKSVASVTPMSNSSTITSFPEIFKSNELFENKDIEFIDQEFKKIQCSPEIYIETPTGHGFCMAMSREAIERVGSFDEVFGKGYSEENDWCMKAAKKGFKNLIAPNIFCFHNHTSSFSDDQRQKLINKNSAIIHQRYPGYSAKVQKTAGDEKYNSIRQLTLALLYARSATKTIACFTNSLSGGSTFANIDFIDKHRDSNCLINIRSAFRTEKYQLEIHYDNDIINFTFESIENIENILNLFDIDEVVIHQLCGYIKLPELLKIISKTKQNNDFHLQMDLRDFFSICPTVQLLDHNSKFCHGSNDLDYCSGCISKLGQQDPSFVDIPTWRKMWQDFFVCMDKINVYSNFTKTTILKIFGNSVKENKIHLGHIPINYVAPIDIKPKKNDACINIAVTGNILIHKGLEILNEMADIIKTNTLPAKINIVIIGKLDPRYNHPLFKHHGQYEREDISSIIEKQQIDIILIPSIWGETYCRTAQEAMLMNAPVACFNLGAPAQRVSKYDKGLVISRIDAKAAIDEITDFVMQLRNDNHNAQNFAAPIAESN